MDDTANNYLAILTSLQSPGLARYGQETRNNIYVVASLFEIEQIRPLMLAILRSFEVGEARRAFFLLLSWSVRFLIAGGGGGGALEKHYGARAQEITSGSVKSASALAKAMVDVVPKDTEFKVAFERLRVTKAKLARYYLRCLEKRRRKEESPHLAEFEAPERQENLEHIMPGSATTAWDIPPEITSAYYKRLGNMCLLGAKQNVAIGNQKYSDKIPTYAESPFLLTQEVVDFSASKWGAEEIERRRRSLPKKHRSYGRVDIRYGRLGGAA
ncbi:MAG TPA: HNH endonuclease family protein [Thermoanaerobaculia bacterium]|nr:HNH endonuclease family protein [Thermoanaerobaculia bacterium]